MIVITGGLGYIGSLVATILSKNNEKVLILDNYSIDTSHIAPLLLDKNITIRDVDITTDTSLNNYLSEAEAVVHLAGIVGYPACDANKELARVTNVDGTKRILDILDPAIPLINASTGSIYGIVEGICTEDTIPNPQSVYAETKLEAEHLVSDFGGVSLRFATLFGPSFRNREDLLINNLVKTAITKGEYVMYEPDSMRTFLNVYNAAEAICGFIKDSKNGFENKIYNIGNEELNMTKRFVGLLIKKHIDYDLTFDEFDKDADRRDYGVSYELYRKEFGDTHFKPLDIHSSIVNFIKMWKA